MIIVYSWVKYFYTVIYCSMFSFNWNKQSLKKIKWNYLFRFQRFQMTKTEIIETWDALHYLAQFVQFRKHEKHPWRKGNFQASAIANSTNGTKSCKASHMSTYNHRLVFNWPTNLLRVKESWVSFATMREIPKIRAIQGYLPYIVAWGLNIEI